MLMSNLISKFLKLMRIPLNLNFALFAHKITLQQDATVSLFALFWAATNSF